MILSLTQISKPTSSWLDRAVAITCFEAAEHMMGCNLYPDQISTIEPYIDVDEDDNSDDDSDHDDNDDHTDDS